MSNNPLNPMTTLPPEPITDIDGKNLEKVHKFIEDGLPGIATLVDTNLNQMMDLYLTGKSYREISNIMRIPMGLILYVSYKFKWYEKRREYVIELEESIRNRIVDSKIESQTFLLQLIHLWQKKIGDQVNSYLRTNDMAKANEIDLKEVDRYLKAIDTLHKIQTMGTGSKSGGSSPIGLNVGEGVTITKSSDGSVDITPKQKTTADMLKEFADYRRETEGTKPTTKNSEESEGAKNENEEK